MSALPSGVVPLLPTGGYTTLVVYVGGAGVSLAPLLAGYGSSGARERWDSCWREAGAWVLPMLRLGHANRMHSGVFGCCYRAAVPLMQPTHSGTTSALAMFTAAPMQVLQPCTLKIRSRKSVVATVPIKQSYPLLKWSIALRQLWMPRPILSLWLWRAPTRYQ